MRNPNKSKIPFQVLPDARTSIDGWDSGREGEPAGCFNHGLSSEVNGLELYFSTHLC